MKIFLRTLDYEKGTEPDNVVVAKAVYSSRARGGLRFFYKGLSAKNGGEARGKGVGKLAKSGVARRKNMPGGSRAESMKLLIYYKSEGENEREVSARYEMRWYRQANKNRRRKRRHRLLLS